MAPGLNSTPVRGTRTPHKCTSDEVRPRRLQLAETGTIYLCEPTIFVQSDGTTKHHVPATANEPNLAFSYLSVGWMRSMFRAVLVSLNRDLQDIYGGLLPYCCGNLGEVREI